MEMDDVMKNRAGIQGKGHLENTSWDFNKDVFVCV